MQQDDDNQNLVLGILFGIIALVIALVIGLTTYVTGQNRAPKAVEAAPAVAAPAEEVPEIVEVGEPLVKFYFESGETVLPAVAAEGIAKVVAQLGEEPAKIALISGYHDETGSAAVNGEVAKARALAVREALLAAGVAADRIAARKPAVTLGGVNPEEARRVEVRVQ
ncbi:OmpA family protein [Zoogloea sp.]|uniref:OmpA family protein n=1 Tax=Zoogloea sp. TaxID=49181 RepID=UPI002638A87A|nr:OmpA family protein [Zoogloea sp.]MDD3355196.1 OmpA family protein [Zoogloea sp.]